MAERSESSLEVNLNEGCRCAELEKELEATKIKLTISEKEVAKLERQIAITDGYSEDLRRQVDFLSAQLHAFKSSAHSTRTVCDASTECEEQQHGIVRNFWTPRHFDPSNCTRTYLLDALMPDPLSWIGFCILLSGQAHCFSRQEYIPEVSVSRPLFNQPA